MLYLHMARRTAPGEVPLADLLNIRHRIPTTTREESHPHVDDGALNTIYNACDVGMNTSEKEGWGLIAFEHGATRSPQVVPNHGACTELGQRSALLLDTAGEREPTAMPCCGQKRYPASRSAKVGARISLGRSCASVSNAGSSSRLAIPWHVRSLRSSPGTVPARGEVGSREKTPLVWEPRRSAYPKRQTVSCDRARSTVRHSVRPSSNSRHERVVQRQQFARSGLQAGLPLWLARFRWEVNSRFYNSHEEAGAKVLSTSQHDLA